MMCGLDLHMSIEVRQSAGPLSLQPSRARENNSRANCSIVGEPSGVKQPAKVTGIHSELHVNSVKFTVEQ